jgi:hypothetical protein
MKMEAVSVFEIPEIEYKYAGFCYPKTGFILTSEDKAKKSHAVFYI